MGSTLLKGRYRGRHDEGERHASHFARAPPSAPVRARQAAFAWSSACPRLGCRRPFPEHTGSRVLSRRRLVPRLRSPHCRPVGEEAWPSCASVLHGPMLCSRLALHARARCSLLCPSFSPSNNPAAASPRVPEGYSSLRAGLLLAVCSFETISHAQRGQSGWLRFAACHPAPGMTGASAARRGGQPGAERRWRGCM